MAVKKLWLAPLALAVGASAASPDVLVMEDGRRLRGELVSISGRTVVFDEYDTRYSNNRTRRVRVNKDDVLRINLRDDVEEEFDDDGFNNNDGWFGGSAGSAGSVGGLGNDVMIRGDQQWTDTGIRLRAGDTFRIEATGYINWGPNRSDGPNGEVNSPYNAARPIPNRPGAALIGRIGNGAPFFVGSGLNTFRAGETGRLYLGVNDDYLRDNSGSFRVRVGR